MRIKSIVSFPLRRLKRYRVGRGFSVHSPFAFYFITRVLRERLPYYCFKNEITGKQERCLFRVINHFRPQTVCLIGGKCSPDIMAVIAAACPTAQIVDTPAKADFTIVTEGNIPAESKIAYSLNGATVPADAMTFTNGRSIIAVRRAGLPHQHFCLSF